MLRPLALSTHGWTVIGAPLGGLLATTVGLRFALWTAAAGIALAALALAASPFRRA
jgi:predicted MFS family arabinose efflux permease